MTDAPARPQDGRVAIITGADSGLGLAFADRLIAAGARIAMVARRAAAPALDPAIAERGWEGAARPFYIDASLADAADDLLDAVFEEFGRMDVLINNAGIRSRKRFAEIDARDWDEVVAANMRDPFFLSQKFAARLLARGAKGAIVNVASQLGIVAARDYSLYCISKGGLISMTKAMAIELARDGISVNAVAPGPTNTVKAGLLSDEDEVIDFLQRMPIGRRVEQMEVADAVAYLATTAGGAVTGHVLVVDGGWTIW